MIPKPWCIRRLELRFDAVASEAPTTPPGHHAPARPSSRVLNFGGAPQGPSCALNPDIPRSVWRETFPAGMARPMSGLQSAHGSGAAGWAGAAASPVGGGGRSGGSGGSTLLAALEALGGAVDEDAMRIVVIGVALGLQVRGSQTLNPRSPSLKRLMKGGDASSIYPFVIWPHFFVSLTCRTLSSARHPVAKCRPSIPLDAFYNVVDGVVSRAPTTTS